MKTFKRLLSYMPSFLISYEPEETITDDLVKKASDLGIAPEELIKRFIDQGIRSTDTSPSKTGNSLKEFLVANGAIKNA